MARAAYLISFIRLEFWRRRYFYLNQNGRRRRRLPKDKFMRYNVADKPDSGRPRCSIAFRNQSDAYGDALGTLLSCLSVPEERSRSGDLCRKASQATLGNSFRDPECCNKDGVHKEHRPHKGTK
jgi:hypothetical protein